MSTTTRLILGIAALAIVAYAMYAAVDAFYLAPRAELRDDIDRSEGILEQFRSERSKHRELREQLQSIADRSLGSDEETVETTLRARLNRAAEEIGLADRTVTTSGGRVYGSPAARAMSRSNPFRDTPDYAELGGSISGRGTLEQAISMVHRIEAAPWNKRISSVSLDPRDDGARFEVTVRLTTMYLPGMAPGNHVEHASYDGSGFARYASLVEAQPFRVPPKPAPPPEQSSQEEQAPPRPPAPPPYDYGQWSLTMLTETSRGWEAWMINRSTGDRRTLAIGDSIENAEFVAASPDAAEFELEDSRFLIEVGATLADGRPVSR